MHTIRQELDEIRIPILIFTESVRPFQTLKFLIINESNTRLNRLIKYFSCECNVCFEYVNVFLLVRIKSYLLTALSVERSQQVFN